MLITEPKIIFLKDYKQPLFLIDTVDLRFEFFEEFTRVHSKLKVLRKQGVSSQVPLELVGEELNLISIAIDDKPLEKKEYLLTKEALFIKEVKAEYQLTIVTEIKPQENTKLEGLYKSSGNFCTQCEAEGFRRITYYLDRPDVMAKYTCTLEADKKLYPILLSNGNPIQHGDLPNGRHFVKWEDPFRKPSYLFAVVAGDLLYKESFFKTMSGRKVQVRVYVEKENLDQCNHALTSILKSMKWDEERFGREYDLDYFNIVAVNDFNMGAMENKGLNIFNSKYVLAKPETATDNDYFGIESVIGHEYFHNWSGNRVTCRDWFQLSLKEGLTVFRDQEFSSDMQSRPVVRINNVNILRSTQFPQDSGPTAHPVRPEEYAEINNFYTATVYDKGAEVIRMMHTILGETKFRKGLDLYFARHDGEAVTVEDFVSAMQDASQIDLSQFKFWYNQAGTPSVDVEITYSADGSEAVFTFSQTCPATPGQPTKEAFYIPIKIGFLDTKGRDISVNCEGNVTSSNGGSVILHLTEKTQSIKLKNLPEKITPSFLRNFSAPIKLNYNYSEEELAFLISHDSDSFNRWEAGQIYAKNVIFKNIKAFHRGDTLLSDEKFLSAYERLLTSKDLDGAFKALSISLPSEAYISELMPRVDIEGVHTAHKFLEESIAKRFHKQYLEIYFENVSNNVYDFNKVDYAKRCLKNKALYYLMQIAGKEEIELCYSQYKRANNMTDTVAALTLLSNINCEERNVALDEFYKKWKKEPLVVNKWLTFQANSKLANTLENVKKLMGHESFDIKNPNRVRALIGTYLFNRVCFHDINGSGYQFLYDVIKQIDTLNPQIAARMIGSIVSYKKFDDIRMQKMKDVLENISKLPNLSKDVSELVMKSLR